MSINNVVSTIALDSSLVLSQGTMSVAPALIEYTVVTKGFSNFHGMYDDPIILIPARPGYLHIVDTVVIAMNADGLMSAFSNGGSIYCQYTNTPQTTNVICSNRITATQLYALQDDSILTIPGGFPANTDLGASTFWSVSVGSPVCLTNDTEPFSGGEETTLSIHIKYWSITFVA